MTAASTATPTARAELPSVRSAQPKGRSTRWPSRAVELALCGVVFLMYLPVLVVPYGFLDDYTALAGHAGLPGQGSTWKILTQQGRPLGGLFLQGAYSLTSSIGSLRWVRLIAVLGIALVAVLIHRTLARHGTDRRISLATALIVVSLPSFQVYSNFGLASIAPYAALLGGFASVRATAAAEERGRAALKPLASSAGLLLAALLLYQPTAMFFWVFAAIVLLQRNLPAGHARRICRAHVLVAVPSLTAAYIAFKVAVHFYGPYVPWRAGATGDIPGKLRWFIEQPVVNALNLVDVTPSKAVAVVVAALLALGIVFLHGHRGRGALGFLAVAVALVPLSYLPNLVAQENWASYRSIGALAALITVYIALLASGIGHAARLRTRRLSRTWLTRSGTLLLIAVCAGAVALAARNVSTLFVKTQSEELRMVRTMLAASGHGSVARVVFIQPSTDQSAAPIVRYDEFGYPTSTSGWAPEPIVFLLLREEHRSGSVIATVPPGTTTIPRGTIPRGSTVVDMRRLGSARVGWSWWTLSGQR